MTGTIIICVFGYGMTILIALATINLGMKAGRSAAAKDALALIIGCVFTMLMAAFTRWLSGGAL